MKESDPETPLAARVAYDQLKPVRTSELHRVQHEVSIPPTEVPSNDVSSESDVDTSFREDICQSALPVTSDETEANVEVVTEHAAPISNDVGPLPSVPSSEANAEVGTDPTVTSAPLTSSGEPSSDCNREVGSPVRKRGRYDVPHDVEDVLFVGTSAPKRRRAETLPVATASKMPQELEAMRRVLHRGLELTDLHMDHCSAMLKEQFPDVDGLQPMSVFQSTGCQRIGTPVGKFVQILLVGNHWITVSNMNCTDEGEIKVYDSIYRKTPKTYKKRFLGQLGWLVHTSAPAINQQWPDVQTQKGNKACGLFAIANAFALCAGLKPEDHAWDQSRMSQHLISCLDSDHLSLFPVLFPGGRPNKGVVHTESEPVFCVCRQPNQERLAMAECESCKEWYHRKCEPMPWPIKRNTRFACHRCK